jgi:hypothetical protein
MQKENPVIYNPNISCVKMKELIFQGKILILTNCKSSRVLTEFAVQFLKDNLQTENLNEFEHTVSRKYFFEILSSLKAKFSNLAETKKFIQRIMEELDFPINTIYFDLMRIRSITSYAHKIPEAKPAFAIHRDTWYANPEYQINWWIPLFDVNEEDTFSFYPDYFAKPVKNNSNEFDYDLWNKMGGFQSSQENKDRVFPELKENINYNDAIKIPCSAGDLLLFSASHLHGTSPNVTNKTRFSLDFRTIDIKDIGKHFAPNVDNQSKGTILEDMFSVKNFEKFENKL